MRFVLTLAVIVAAVPLSACGTWADYTWRGRAFEEVRSVRDLPGSIRRSLGVERMGLAGMADAGEPFNRSDDMASPRWPTRRFAMAARSAETWVVAYEQGGFAYGVNIVLFDTPAASPQPLASQSKPPGSLDELLALLPD